MVDDLISDAMMDAHDIAIKREPVDLAAMLAEVVTANRALAERKQQTIQFVVAAAPAVELRSRPAARGGRQSPEQRHQVQPDRRQRSSSRCGWTTRPSVIRVQDDGPGLSQDDVSRLFGRFQRLSAKPTGGESSTGLGLSIVKRIVELHGGTHQRRKATAPASGATFTIRLPVAADGAAMNRSQHIIVVDDEAPAREMVGDYLKLHGFEVTLCDGGSSLRRVIAQAASRSDRARPQHAGGGRPLHRPRGQAARATCRSSC